MNKTKAFITTSVLGGVTVILPVTILIAVFQWIFDVVMRIIKPATHIIVVRADVKEFIAGFFVIIIILAVCFLLGVLIRTRVGKFLHVLIEDKLFARAPGYKLIKDTVVQILGNKKAPFSSVALARIFGNETLVTSFITDEHPDGTYTVFVPTGPNPTSGNIYHLKKEFVCLIDIPVDEAMRSIISCGAGSAELISRYIAGTKKS